MAELIRTLNTVVLIYDLSHQYLRAGRFSNPILHSEIASLTTEVHFIINVALFYYHNINQQSNLNSHHIISQCGQSFHFNISNIINR